MAAMLGALLVLVGATFVGADYSSGSLSNQLLFRPRRWQVWLAKSAALAVAGVVAAIVLIGSANLVIWGFAEAWDRPVDAETVENIVLAVGRSAFLCGMLAVVGFAIALITRHTAAALGLIALYGIAGETVARLVWPGSERWLLSNHSGRVPRRRLAAGELRALQRYRLQHRTALLDVLEFTGEYAAGYLGHPLPPS